MKQFPTDQRPPGLRAGTQADMHHESWWLAGWRTPGPLSLQHKGQSSSQPRSALAPLMLRVPARPQKQPIQEAVWLPWLTHGDTCHGSTPPRANDGPSFLVQALFPGLQELQVQWQCSQGQIKVMCS